MKILMATMSLDIGGAETHIVELSRELARRGHDVTVASNGGVYIPELERGGVGHVKIPFHTKRPDLVLKAIFLLRRELKRGNYDLVHAHARIPAAICSLVCGMTGTRLVTTAHGVFKLTPAFKMIARWGERTLAVSCDIKQYLIEGYGLPSDNIRVTVNGIDTNRFSRRPDERHANGLEAELGLDPSCRHRALYVSRIDREAAHVAFMLAESAPELVKRFPDLEIVIAGGGTAFEELSEAAERANALCGRRAVILAGARSDMHRFPPVCDVFIGVSRSAMEAMAACMPIVLTGSQGYIGVLTPELEGLAASTNLTCRGERMPDAPSVAADVERVLAMTPEERLALGEWGRSLILRDYSVTRMADDAEAMYRSVRPFKKYKRGDIILSGYYGFGNTGDDSLLQLITSELREQNPDAKITVLSRTPKATARIFGLRSLQRFNLLSVAREMRYAKLLICGGGSLLQNSTSTRSLFYYTHIMHMAKKRGMKVMLYASGIGPLIGEKARRMAADAINASDMVTLREYASLRELQNLCPRKAVYAGVTADPAFTLTPADRGWVRRLLINAGVPDADVPLRGEDGGFRCFALSLRGHTAVGEGFYDAAADAAAEISRRTGLTPLLIPLQPVQDEAICRAAAAKCGGIVISNLTASELAGVCAECAFTAGMRLHILIYSAVAGTPVVGLECDPKISAFADLCGISDYVLPVTAAAMSALPGLAEKALERRQALSASLASSASSLGSRSRSDAVLAMWGVGFFPGGRG